MRTAMAIDWIWVEELVVKHATRALADLAESHAASGGEPFSAALFLVEPFDGVAIDLLLDTDPATTFHAATFRYALEVSKQIEPWADVGEAIFEATEADMDDARTTATGDFVTTAKFLDAVCRAALRLETTAFAELACTPDFAIAVSADPTEPGELARARYATFKKAAAAAPSAEPGGRR